MTRAEFVAWIERTADWPINVYIGSTDWWVWLDAAHILTQALVVGTIILVDLRLLGLAFPTTRVTELARRILPWTWLGFFGAAASGTLLFLIRSGMYAENRSFWIKIALMAFAGLNMAVLHGGAWRNVGVWDRGSTPLSAKIAGLMSLACWIGAVFFARYIWFPWSEGH